MTSSFPPLARFRPISLQEANRIARLQERVDRKYLVNRDVFSAIADELARSYSVVEVEGKQVLQYDTVYFDTDGLLCYRSHLQGRRRRFKLRTRRYADSGHCFFELKYKDARGRTSKERIDYPWELHGEIDTNASAFVASTLLRRYGMTFASEVSPALDVSYRRMTLVNLGGAERITCDFDLSFRTAGGETRLGDDYMILETKGDFRFSAADLLLRSRGYRPINCSKYCVGVASCDPRVKNNPFRPVLRRYFGLEQRTWAVNPL